MIQAISKGQEMKFTPLKIPIRVQKLIHKNRMPAAHAVLYAYILEQKKVYERDIELAARFGGGERRMKGMLAWLEEMGFIRRESIAGESFQDGFHRRVIIPVKGKK